jgi:hypothetical protein
MTGRSGNDVVKRNGLKVRNNSFAIRYSRLYFTFVSEQTWMLGVTTPLRIAYR